MEEHNSPVIEIAGREVGGTAPVFVIAEIGINHNGSVDLAKEMISAAKWAGADAVKFQKRTPEITTPEYAKNQLRDTPWGSMTYLEYKKKIEFSQNQYAQIADHCSREGILWSASSWDMTSLQFMQALDVPFHKIPSALFGDLELIKQANAYSTPLICSTGMSTWSQIQLVVDQVDRGKTAALHTVSAYPTPAEATNLSTLVEMRRKLGVVVGYSGHEQGTAVSVVAAGLGAAIVERHFTLRKSMWGTDQSSSLEPPDLQRLVSKIQDIKASLASPARESQLEIENFAAARLKQTHGNKQNI